MFLEKKQALFYFYLPLAFSVKLITICDTMKKAYALKLFGSTKALAKALGITVHAIYQWPDPIPLLREYQIREYLSARKNT